MGIRVGDGGGGRGRGINIYVDERQVGDQLKKVGKRCGSSIMRHKISERVLAGAI